MASTLSEEKCFLKVNSPTCIRKEIIQQIRIFCSEAILSSLPGPQLKHTIQEHMQNYPVNKQINCILVLFICYAKKLQNHSYILQLLYFQYLLVVPLFGARTTADNGKIQCYAIPACLYLSSHAQIRMCHCQKSLVFILNYCKDKESGCFTLK